MAGPRGDRRRRLPGRSLRNVAAGSPTLRHGGRAHDGHRGSRRRERRVWHVPGLGRRQARPSRGPLDPAGKRLHDAELPNAEAGLRRLFDQLARHGRILAVVEQPASIGALPVAVARATGHQIAYLPGLIMRRLANLHPGTAKTDARDAWVIADAARPLPHTLRRVDAGDDTRWSPPSPGRSRPAPTVRRRRRSQDISVLSSPGEP
jgi:hypothetical protein